MSDDPRSSYDAATEQLTVTFTVFRKRVAPLIPSGKPYAYRYDDVPEAVADTWLDDEGNGEYYNSTIRNAYDFTRLT